MLRPRPEPSDLAASLVPRMGDTPFAPSLYKFGAGGRPRLSRPFIDPAQEARDADEQQAIADAVEGVIP